MRYFNNADENIRSLMRWSLVLFIIIQGCIQSEKSTIIRPKISMVNAPTDIVTLGGIFLANNINEKSGGDIQPRVYHSGVLSGGKGNAEIEMCQQGTIEIHITTTAYLANLVRKTSIVSLPFLFRDINQVAGLVKSKSSVLEIINSELNTKNLNIIAWWPRGFRQLTNNKRPVKNIEDIRGLKLRVMTNQLFVDNMNAMGAHPVPMAWGEVYNGLQLNTINGQENAEDVIYSSRLYEVQQFMTIWDYSTDIEVVLVNVEWWNNLSAEQRQMIQEVADASVAYEEELLKKNTKELRSKIAQEGMQIHYLSPEEKIHFKEAVKSVWDKYEKTFSKTFMDAFLAEIEKY